MKKVFAILLLVCLLSGCQLATEEQSETVLNDKLVGVFVTFEHLDLEFDIEGWLSDNPGALKNGDVTLGPGEAMEYAGRLPVTVGEDGWKVPDREGLSIGRLWNGECWTCFSNEGICELNSHITAGDNGDTIEEEGTIYFPAGSEVLFYSNPVYMTEAGEYYVVQGNSFHSALEAGGSMSQGVSDEQTWTEDGLEKRYSATYITTVKGVTLPETVRLIWMTADHQELARAEYVPGQMPETVEAQGAYLILEEIAGETVTRKLYQPGDGHITVCYQGDQPWCLPEYVQIIWPE